MAESETLPASVVPEAFRAGPGPAGPVGGFLVDPDRANTAVAKLDEVLGRLTDTLADLAFRGRMEPPGADHVSARIAQNTTQMITNAEVYLRGLCDQVEATRNALCAQIDAYQRADDPDGFRG